MRANGAGGSVTTGLKLLYSQTLVCAWYADSQSLTTAADSLSEFSFLPMSMPQCVFCAVRLRCIMLIALGDLFPKSVTSSQGDNGVAASKQSVYVSVCLYV